MTGPDPDIEAIFTAARAKRSVRDRATYLREACGDNEQLRDRVEELLSADHDAGALPSGDNQPDVLLRIAELIA